LQILRIVFRIGQLHFLIEFSLILFYLQL
jgi:hypothetical protein